MNNIPDWVMTYTGKKMDPLNPREEDIDIIDIAHSLSLKCRFAGHCKEFYSVAQHSVLISELSYHYPFEALMHDAAESYLPDVTKPVKERLSGFKEIEENLIKVIFKKYNLIYPLPVEVKRMDLALCLTEGRDLMFDISEWDLTKWFIPLEMEVKGWSFRESRSRFIKRFKELNSRR